MYKFFHRKQGYRHLGYFNLRVEIKIKKKTEKKKTEKKKKKQKKTPKSNKIKNLKIWEMRSEYKLEFFFSIIKKIYNNKKMSF